MPYSFEADILLLISCPLQSLEKIYGFFTLCLEIAGNCRKPIEVELGIGQLEFSGYILEPAVFPLLFVFWFMVCYYSKIEKTTLN